MFLILFYLFYNFKKGNELIQYNEPILNSGDLFLNDDLFQFSDYHSKLLAGGNLNANEEKTNRVHTLKLPIRQITSPTSSTNELHTPSIYIDSDPSEKSKFKWN